ncbi:PepSY domain-containing protein [Halomonas sp. HMF6819]|uniref:PepSY domain-containing protein n=1 Tax=unclassified Halomonas TaxID=2609666 RepID=UPI0020767ECA|nr:MULTISPECIES: PepSY domain-containing protein [unclassified Halomonas]
MTPMKKAVLLPASALLLVATTAAQADRLPLERLDEVLNYTANYGFTHLEELSVDDGRRIEAEGWLDEEWFADVEFSLDSGESLSEERERLVSGAWGMSEDDIRQAFEMARQEGMTAFEEIDISRSGIIDIEGESDDGRDIEISVRQGSFDVVEIDRD